LATLGHVEHATDFLPSVLLQMHAGNAYRRTRCAFFWSKLDVNFDGNVTRGEFERRAPDVLMPLEELELEAKFYEGCSKALDKVRAEENLKLMVEKVKRGEIAAPQTEEDGGCVYQ